MSEHSSLLISQKRFVSFGKVYNHIDFYIVSVKPREIINYQSTHVSAQKKQILTAISITLQTQQHFALFLLYSEIPKHALR
jgi:hypothetical protein